MAMNKSVLMAAVLAVPVMAAAQSNVTMFGVIDVTLKRVTMGSQSYKIEDANGNTVSRFGFRGEEDLGGGLKAGFWLESGLSPDTGTQASAAKFWNRRSTVSLISNTLGELRLGRDYVPTFWNQAFYDPFMLNGSGAAFNLTSANPGPYDPFNSGIATAVRSDNSVGYLLPKNLGGVYGQFMASLGEGASANQKYRGGRLGYAAGPLDISASYGETVTTTPDKLKVAVAAASYNFGVVQLMGSMVQMKWGLRKQNNLMGGVVVPAGSGEIRASLQRANASGAGTDANDATQAALGYTYNLSKRTVLYTTYSRLNNKGNANFIVYIPGAGGTPPKGVAGRSSSGFDLGLRHAF